MIDLERLKSRLEELHLTPNAASQMSGLGRDYVRDILRGRIGQPSAFRLSRLAATLQCTPGYLMGKAEENPSIDPDVRADDREIALEHAIAKNKRILARDETSHREFGVAYLDLLDSVSDKSLAELSYVSVNSMIYTLLDEETKLTPAEKRVLLGDPPGMGVDPFFERRAVLAKVLGIISQRTMACVISLAAFWDAVKDLPSDQVFADPRAKDALHPMMKVHRLPFSAETARVALIGTVTRFISNNPETARDLNREDPDNSPPLPQSPPDGADS